MIQKSIDYKLAAVKYYLDNKVSQKEVCDIFNCSIRSLSRWVEKYNRTGSIKNKVREYVSYKVTKEHVQFIIDEINKNNTITAVELKLCLQNKFNIQLSQVHISRIIKDNNITLKNTRVIHKPNKRFGKSINIKEKIEEFYNNVKNYKIEDIICIDETSISSIPSRSKGYSIIGKRCIIKTQSQEVFKKYTGVFAISVNGILGYELYEKNGIDSLRLANFLNKFILNKFKNKLIILDNASSHKNSTIKDLISINNNILYTVPYQHYTNAIENFFSVLKSKLHKCNGLSYLDLQDDIKNIIKELSVDMYKNIINGTYNREKNFIKNKAPRLRKIKKYL
jgi:transposase